MYEKGRIWTESWGIWLWINFYDFKNLFFTIFWFVSTNSDNCAKCGHSKGTRRNRKPREKRTLRRWFTFSLVFLTHTQTKKKKARARQISGRTSPSVRDCCVCVCVCVWVYKCVRERGERTSNSAQMPMLAETTSTMEEGYKKTFVWTGDWLTHTQQLKHVKRFFFLFPPETDVVIAFLDSGSAAVKAAVQVKRSCLLCVCVCVCV